MRPFIAAALVAALALSLAVPQVIAEPSSCAYACQQRVKSKWLERHYQRVWRAAPVTVRAHLRRIAACESGGDERAISPSGQYRGLLQFDYATFASVGGQGDPAKASRWEQWSRGVRLYLKRGSQPWPVCRFR